MKNHDFPVIARSVCPHDCPSTCALDIEIVDEKTIGRVHGAKNDPYTDGVICEKVARYKERIHHPDRLLYPLRRAGEKGAGKWQRISWDEALDEIAQRFLALEEQFGPESIWPYQYAGTMGHVMRGSIERLRNAKNYSGQKQTICSMVAWAGYVAGAGMQSGVSPEDMAKSECIVIWGTNPVHTQVNLMTHAIKARKNNGAKIIVVDIYETATMKQADIGLVLRPGSDGALATAVMHVLLKEKLADFDYMAKFTDFSPQFAQHLAKKTPQWAAEITGLTQKEIVEFARLIGNKKATYFRLGFGFTRQRNGATNMHAALSIPAMSGAWQYPGGGAFHSSGSIWGLDKSLIEGKNPAQTPSRVLDMSEIGPILTGDKKTLKNGPPVKAMLIENTNPMVVAPEQAKVRQGFERKDLFVVVHEQFMTETAQMADIVLPATMFLEHEDYYTRGGHTRVLYGPKIIDAPGEARSNHYLINQLGRRLGATGEGFELDDKQMVARTLARSGYGELAKIAKTGFVERAPTEEEASFANGFAWSDKKFRFEPNWEETRLMRNVDWVCKPADMPRFADYFAANEPNDKEHEFRLATSPARGFLNTTFNETPGSQKREKHPRAFIHPDDAKMLGIVDGQMIEIGNRRGRVLLNAAIFDGLQRAVVIVEGLHKNGEHQDGQGINTLIGSDPIAPFGGAAFHDCAVWLKPAKPQNQI
ncbi:Anaerobic dehydrogenases, typically selenocysteine-containing [hydrothermal vent metagenome]|uniref:Anaerobic dehydrogenases, typically selenocysteine-containing n=1 Tax=hydrothermal vent metagenome TaxID=652676 RepID=A0A3B0TV44_9ZZZZ